MIKKNKIIIWGIIFLLILLFSAYFLLDRSRTANRVNAIKEMKEKVESAKSHDEKRQYVLQALETIKNNKPFLTLTVNISKAGRGTSFGYFSESGNWVGIGISCNELGYRLYGGDYGIYSADDVSWFIEGSGAYGRDC